jgi:Lrp/AsnC family transcriptional regulator for asnA, asnC and gidA
LRASGNRLTLRIKCIEALTKCAAAGTNDLALRSIPPPRSIPAASRGPVRSPRHIDALDQGIVEALQANGRESFRRIAARLGVSEATIRARYAKLAADDILQVVAVTNPLGLGFDAMALVAVRTSGAPDPVADEISTWPEASYVIVTAGQYDLLVELVCDDRRALLDVTNRMRELDGVASTESFLYLQMVKQLYDWGTRVHDEEAAR